MKTRITLLLCFILLCSHDMYLKMDSYFLEPDTQAEVLLFNGTFDKSENVITRDRMLDASIVSNGLRNKIENSQWTEKDSTTLLNFQTDNAGTYLVGVSTAARNIKMKAEDFNNYLKHDGVIDMLESRKENKLLDEDAVEKYSKHVKAIFQVGNEKTDDWSTELGYPIEFIPLSNPYELHTGDTIEVKLLRDGSPLNNQLVYADYRPSNHGHSHEHKNDGNEHSHEHQHNEGENYVHKDGSKEQSHKHKDDAKEHSHKDESSNVHEHSHEYDGKNHNHEHLHDSDKKNQLHDHTESVADINHEHTSGKQLRTDENGIVSVNLINDGLWFLRTIHLENSEEEGLTHESNWATLTFEVTHDHDDDKHGHSHNHNDDDGISLYWFIIASVLIIGGLFLYFNKQKKA